MNQVDPPADKPAGALPGHDALSRLARDDPQAFEALRLELIEQCIEDAPEHLRTHLRRLQFRIDAIRLRSQSPLGAAIKIHALMWESFLELNDQLQAFASGREAPACQPAPAGRTARSAQVIPFRQPTVVEPADQTV